MKMFRNLLIISAALCMLEGSAPVSHAQAPKTSNRALIAVPTVSPVFISARSVDVRFPAGTLPASIKAKLNGKDVSIKMHERACSGYVCMTADFSAEDGLGQGSNLLTATGKNQDGTASSLRLHFEGSEAASARPMAARSAATTVASFPGATASMPTSSSFLPPTIAFSTTQQGGPGASAPWFQLGTNITLSSGSCAGSSRYSVITLDRRTLVQAGTAQCYNDGASLKSALNAMATQSPAQNQIVIVGTNAEQATDANAANDQLDTTAIGGHAFNCNPSQTLPAACPNSAAAGSNADIPNSYLAIGALNAKPGSAFEFYNSPIYGANAYATGMLVEDANGNYNFQSSNNVEYIVQPGTANQQAQITLYNPPGVPGNNVVYTQPTGVNNGMWLLILARDGLNAQPGCSSSFSNGVYTVPNCGTFYPTGSASNAVVQSLASALANIPKYQIAILTSIGTAGWDTPQNMAKNNFGPDTSNNNIAALGGAFQLYGMPDKSFLWSGTQGSTWTMVGVPGLGGPYNGHNVLSSNLFPQQGQSGYIHGTFARDSNGLYEPAHSEQQNSTSDTANLQLGLVLADAPVEWPEFSAPLVAGNTLTGQTQAYQYLSYYLLNQWYVAGQLDPVTGKPSPGVTGTYAYDIHYFFTGSLNTRLDYHTYDPANATYPGTSWTSPDGTTLSFTQQEFNAVKYQMHNELVALDNVLTYFVTGSTNFKDLVAAGNANTALTLLQAVNNVQANINQQALVSPATPVTVSPWHIMHMIASDASPYVSFATDGVVNPADIALADKAIGFIGDLFAASGSTGGGLSSGDNSAQKDIPRLDYKLETTIGQLAGSDLQGQILAGFDATLDSITSDWGRLQKLGGGSIAKSPLFAPTQTTQNQVISQITKSSQKSLYMSLIPQIYQVHLWAMGGSSKTPDFGYSSNGNGGSCQPFYNNAGGDGVWVNYPTYVGTKYSQTWWGDSGNWYPYQYFSNNPWYDWYVLSLPFANQGHTNASAINMTTALTSLLFTNGPSSLNLVRDAFFTVSGPMDKPITGSTSAIINMAPESSTGNNKSGGQNAIGISNGNVCSVSQLNSSLGSKPTQPDPRTTTTVLTMQQSAVLGSTVVMQAKVAVAKTSAPAGGSVAFFDGNTLLGTMALNASGSASYVASGLGLGAHAITAYFAATDGTLPSDSGAQTLMVYANTPDLQLSLSQLTLNVTYGSTSSAVSLKVLAMSGMSGTVSYACSGLPAGMTCAFSPSTSNVTDGGTATTTFTISGTPITLTSSVGSGAGFGLLALSLSPFLASSFRRRVKATTLLMPLALLVAAASLMTGCGGGSSPSTTFKDTGTKTVLITATGQNITKTIPLVVNIQ